MFGFARLQMGTFRRPKGRNPLSGATKYERIVAFAYALPSQIGPIFPGYPGMPVELTHRIRKGQFKLGKLRIKDKTAPKIWNAVLAA